MSELKPSLVVVQEVMQRVAAYSPATRVVEYVRVKFGEARNRLQYFWEARGICASVEVFYDLEGDGKQIWEARHGFDCQQLKFRRRPPLEQLARAVPRMFTEVPQVSQTVARKNGRNLSYNDVVLVEIMGLGADVKSSSGYGSKLRYIVPKVEYMDALSDAETQFRQQLPCPSVFWQLQFAGKTVSLFIPDIAVIGTGVVQVYEEKYVLTQSMPENRESFETDFDVTKKDAETGRLLMNALAPSKVDLARIVDDIERACKGSVFPRRPRK